MYCTAGHDGHDGHDGQYAPALALGPSGDPVTAARAGLRASGGCPCRPRSRARGAFASFRGDEFVARLEELQGYGCDHDHRHTRAILAAMGLDEQELAASITYLEEKGGFCDCEVRLNVFPQPMT